MEARLAPQAAEQDAPLDSVEAPSGKGAADENFPVGSFLIAPRLRPHVARYYAFARAADDIADDPELSATDKIRRLDAFERALDDGSLAKPAALAESLAETGVPDDCARDLLAAFRMDAVKTRYADWDALIGYCRLSANPVGRFLLRLHGEGDAALPRSDALCTALQVLNHLQDCGDDRRALDRVYLPSDWLAAAGESVAALDQPALSPGLRRVIDQALDHTDALVATAETLAPALRSRRLAAESAAIARLARRLSARLRAGDPLATRVSLSKRDFAGALLYGVWTALLGRRASPHPLEAPS